jgi:hypothetical protein
MCAGIAFLTRLNTRLLYFDFNEISAVGKEMSPIRAQAWEDLGELEIPPE